MPPAQPIIRCANKPANCSARASPSAPCRNWSSYSPMPTNVSASRPSSSWPSATKPMHCWRRQKRTTHNSHASTRSGVWASWAENPKPPSCRSSRCWATATRKYSHRFCAWLPTPITRALPMKRKIFSTHRTPACSCSPGWRWARSVPKNTCRPSSTSSQPTTTRTFSSGTPVSSP